MSLFSMKTAYHWNLFACQFHSVIFLLIHQIYQIYQIHRIHQIHQSYQIHRIHQIYRLICRILKRNLRSN